MNFEISPGTRQYLEKPPPQVLLSSQGLLFLYNTENHLVHRPDKPADVTAVIRHDALPHFPVFDFSPTCAIQPANSWPRIELNSQNRYRHCSASCLRRRLPRLYFNHYIFRATNGLWDIDHLVPPKALPNRASAFIASSSVFCLLRWSSYLPT